MQVKVLDIDRDRQRISLGLKQTQEDPWQRVVDTYRVGDELEGTVTKVVTFGAFVEILDGVEGLVHISELANHHVENPREVVQPGDDVRVKVLEIDSERRRLSLSVKRVEGQVLPSEHRAAAGEPLDLGDLDDVPELGLSEDVFAAERAARRRRSRRGRRRPIGGRGRGGVAEARPRSRRGACAEEAADEAPAAEAEAPAEEARRGGPRPSAAEEPRPRRPPRRRQPRPRRPRRLPRARPDEAAPDAAAEDAEAAEAERRRAEPGRQQT